MRRHHLTTTHGSDWSSPSFRTSSYELTTAKLIHEVAETTSITMPAVGLATPVIGIVSVGEDIAAAEFRQALEYAGLDAGVTIRSTALEKNSTANAVAKCLASFSNDPSCHGVVLQMPLPDHVDALALCDNMEPSKDVDCICDASFKAYLRSKHDIERESPAVMVPCLPSACEALLLSKGRQPEQCRVLLLAIPLVLSEPLQLSLRIAGYDVTVCDADEPAVNARSQCKIADCVIVGKGRSDCVAAQWIRAGCLIMDLGLSLGSSPPSPVLCHLPCSGASVLPLRAPRCPASSCTEVTCLSSGDGLAQRVAALRLSNACQAALLQQGFLEEKPSFPRRQAASNSEPSVRFPAAPAASPGRRRSQTQRGSGRRRSTHVFEYAFE